MSKHITYTANSRVLSRQLTNVISAMQNGKVDQADALLCFQLCAYGEVYEAQLLNIGVLQSRVNQARQLLKKLPFDK